MASKTIIIMLAILLILASAIGVYSYQLNGEIDSLSEQLTTLRAAATASVDKVSSTLATYTQETNSKLATITQESNTELATIDQEIQYNRDSILASEEAVKQNSHLLSELKDEVITIVEGLTEKKTWLQADSIYEAVNHAVIEVSDGRNTIGSGFIYDNQGHVVTASHVIEQLNSIYVVLPDGRSSRATVVGSSSLSDVAVLRLEQRLDVNPLVLANSEKINIGESVVVIGSPFDLSGTITAGIVSQLNRFERIGDDLESRWISSLIQFDAPANFGNSGGPLFNVNGEVIGLVIARVGPTTGGGISYAVTANKVSRVADSIIEQGIFNYPWLGINAADITPEEAEILNLEVINGVIVYDVALDSPAWEAGIQVDDIIISIDGKLIKEMAYLTSYLGEYTKPGDSTVIEVERGAAILQLTVILGTK